MGLHVRFGSKADICAAKSDVRFAPNSDRESRHDRLRMSALLLKADMCSALGDVRFGPIADIATFDVRSCTRLDHCRRKAASKAALHREETERLAVVRHPRILP